MLAALHTVERGQAAAASAECHAAGDGSCSASKDYCAHISDVFASGLAQWVLSAACCAPERPCQCPLWVQAAAAAAERRACDEVCCATRMGIDEDHAIVIEDRAEELGGQDPAAGQADSDSDVVILDNDSQLAQHEPAAHAAQAPDQIAVHYDQARGKAPAPAAWDTSTAQQARCEGHATDTYSDPTGGMAALMPGAGLPGSSSSCLASASLADHHTMHRQPLQAVQTSACDSLFDDDILDLTDD